MIDSHCHLDFDVFDADRAEVIKEAKKNGVDFFVIPGVERFAWTKQKALAKHYPVCRIALGLHPCYVQNHQPSDLAALDAELQMTPVVAVGEIGLDYMHAGHEERAQQLMYFNAQVALAKTHARAIILHVRRAHQEVLECLRENALEKAGIVHAFSGGLACAKQYIDLGFKLGIGGVVMRSNAWRLHETIQQLPLEHFVLETDAPDMAFGAHRGQRNSPVYLDHIAHRVAQLRSLPVETVIQHTRLNTQQILDWEKTC